MSSIDIDKLVYSEELSFFSEVIRNHYHEADIVVYRTIVTVPATQFDITPQCKRTGSEGEAYTSTITQEDVDKLSEEDKVQFVNKRALSVYKTESKCVSEALRSYHRVQKMYGNEEAKKYLENLRGCFVQKLILTPDKAVISDFHKTTKHANALLYKGVSIEDIVDSSYEPQKIPYEGDEA